MSHLVLSGSIYDSQDSNSEVPTGNDLTNRGTHKHKQVFYIENEEDKNKDDSIIKLGSVSLQRSNDSCSNEDSLRRVSFSAPSTSKLYDKQDGDQGGLKNILRETLFNKVFIIHTLTIAVSVPAFNTTLIFYVDYYKSKGISRDDAVKIYMYMNILSKVFRIVPGFVKQIPHISVQLIPVIGSFLGGISLIAFPFVGSSFSLNVVAAVGFGSAMGLMVTTLNVCIIKIVGLHYYSAALGIIMTCIGVCTVAAGPISGYIRDVTGNYNMSLFTAASVMIITSIVFF